MPGVKPSEKTGHEGEWWREDKSNTEQPSADPNYEQHVDVAEKEKTAFDQAQKTTRHPV